MMGPLLLVSSTGFSKQGTDPLTFQVGVKALAA